MRGWWVLVFGLRLGLSVGLWLGLSLAGACKSDPGFTSDALTDAARDAPTGPCPFWASAEDCARCGTPPFDPLVDLPSVTCGEITADCRLCIADAGCTQFCGVGECMFCQRQTDKWVELALDCFCTSDARTMDAP